MNEKNKTPQIDPQIIGDAIRGVCDRRLGVLDAHFMCKSVGSIPCKAPTCAAPTDSVEKVLGLLRENKTGCVVVVNALGEIQGIFSERDFILKISTDYNNKSSCTIDQFMTREPMTVTPDCTLAFALNLMSQGGFRHLPLVDEAGRPNAVLSVKDVVDVIVEQFVSDVMALETEV